jgi:CPA1 family monovalent cation:H+ antiporter
MQVEATLIILFSIATAAAIAARWMKVPYTVALVISGIALGATNLVDPPHLTRELLFAVILPGLLFEAAFNMDVEMFMKDKLPIAALAIPGVIVAILLAGAGVAFGIRAVAPDSGFDLRDGFLFGALVAATDPIAVIAMFKELRVPVRLATLVEGESLMNDGTSIVLLSLLLAAVSGKVSSFGQLALQFVIVVAGGGLLGYIVGTGASKLISRIDDAVIEITITMITAYGTFVFAEQVGTSGVIATVVAAMTCGSQRHSSMTRKTRYALHAFWDYLAFALNSVVFLLIGFEVSGLELLRAWREIVIAFVVVVLARAAVVYGVGGILSKTRNSIPMNWLTVMTWGGLRGALSMVLALSLPVALPARGILIMLTFGVVVTSILVQGLSMQRLLRQLGLGRRTVA